MLRIYHTSVAGANVFSRDGSFEAADEAEGDGTAGEALQRQIFLAPAQTALTDAMLVSSVGAIEQIRVDHPIFDDAAYRILVIGSEKVKIIASGGLGTRDTTVERGYDGTTAAAHAAAASVINCYNYSSIVISRTGAQASLLTFAPDSGGSPGSFTSSLSPSAINYNASLTFWRKITIPASTTRARIVTALPSLAFTAVEAL